MIQGVGDGTEPPSSPISDMDRQRILREEAFRDEVRKSLATKKSRLQKFWAVANSAIILWALSTIAVGSITWMYSRVQERERGNAEGLAQVRKLDTEIAQRLRRLERQLESATTVDEVVVASKEYYRTEQTQFREFEDLNVVEILTQYYRYLPYPEHGLIQDLINASMHLMAWIEVLPESGLPIKDAREYVREALVDQFIDWEAARERSRGSRLPSPSVIGGNSENYPPPDWHESDDRSSNAAPPPPGSRK